MFWGRSTGTINFQSSFVIKDKNDLYRNSSSNIQDTSDLRVLISKLFQERFRLFK